MVLVLNLLCVKVSEVSPRANLKYHIDFERPRDNKLPHGVKVNSAKIAANWLWYHMTINEFLCFILL